MDDGTPSASYNYVVTAHNASAVTHALVGHFTSSKEANLIIATSTHIQIHLLTEQGLEGVIDFPLYGRVASMELFRPAKAEKDLLFIASERYKFCVLEYDSEQGDIITRANGSIRDSVGRVTDNGQLAAVDPACRLIAMHLYDGVVKIIPIDEAGALGEAFNCRLEEMEVHDMQLLHGCRDPTIALLHSDSRQQLFLKTYTVNRDKKELSEGPALHTDPVEQGAHLLITVPPPFNGVMVVGLESITYYNAGHPPRSVAIPRVEIRTFGRVDTSGNRYLLSDSLGRLYLLVLVHDNQQLKELKLQRLGQTSVASALAYLDNGVVYVGSRGADSQLVMLHSKPPDPQEPGCFVQVLESFPNLGPIVDFVVVDLERQGQGQVVTCSGKAQDGSLRIIRNGIGINEQASVEVPGLKGVWALKESWEAKQDTFLLLTFVGQTQVLSMKGGAGGGAGDDMEEDEEEGGLGEVEVPGFDSSAQTLAAGNMSAGGMVQVTPGGVKLVDGKSLQLIGSWAPPDGSSVSVAAVSPSQVLVALGQGRLVYLEVEGGAIREVGTTTVNAEVACLDISPLGEDELRADVAAVGLWSMEGVQVALPSLQEVQRVELGGEVIPRSCLHVKLDGQPYLLVGLGDGQLLSWRIDPTAGLTDRRKVALGTKPILLRKFQSGGQTVVFAACDRPTVVHSSNRKLLYANVNENEVTCMAPFCFDEDADSLALGKEGAMTIGSIDDIQKLHIRTVPLGEQPRRITHHPPARCYAVCTEKVMPSGDKPITMCSVHLIDDTTFDTVASLSLAPNEVGTAIASTPLGGEGPFIVVGTAVVLEEEDEPQRGRLLVLQRAGAQVQVVAEAEVKGAVYSVMGFQGMLLAAVNSRVQLFKWRAGDAGEAGLQLHHQQEGYMLALMMDCRGDFVCVGDVMRSVTLLRYHAPEGHLEVRAKDFNINYMQAMAMLDDDNYLGAENSYNLFVCRKNSDSAAEEERNRLDTVGMFHVGQSVNRFRQGSLVMQLPDSETSLVAPPMLYGSVDGALGVIAPLGKPLFDRLLQLQEAMRKHVKGVGGWDHAEWRSFENERGVFPAQNFVDGDLVEQFLDLQGEDQAAVAAEANVGGVEELVKVVEDLARLH